MSNPFLEKTTIYMYTLQPLRVAIMTEGPTEMEAAVVARHWAYVQDLFTKGMIVFAGRTLVTDEGSFASVVFRADSEGQARDIMNGDPGVSEGIFRSRLYPYQVLLVGPWSRETLA